MRRWLGVLAVLVAAGLLIGAAAFGISYLSRGGAPHTTSIQERCLATTDAGTATLDPEQSANAALIAAVGQAQDMSPRAVTIALATAMQESKIRNLNYGDRDSLGLFQQRPSQDWGTPEQIMDPLYSAGRFYSALAQVPNFEDLPITEAAQLVQRSAYPDAYAQHESAARSFASALTGHSPAALNCVFTPATERESVEKFGAVFRAEWAAAADTALTEPAAQPTPAQGGLVVLQAQTPERAWAYAQWSVAKAKELGVQSVTVAGQIWDRSAGTWNTAPSSAEPTAPTSTQIVLA